MPLCFLGLLDRLAPLPETRLDRAIRKEGNGSGKRSHGSTSVGDDPRRVDLGALRRGLERFSFVDLAWMNPELARLLGD
jgi:hypothetical protein